MDSKMFTDNVCDGWLSIETSFGREFSRFVATEASQHIRHKARLRPSACVSTSKQRHDGMPSAVVPAIQDDHFVVDPVLTGSVVKANSHWAV